MTRLLVLAAMVVFIAGFAYLTISAVAAEGFTPASALSVGILLLLGIGVIGAIRNPPR